MECNKTGAGLSLLGGALLGAAVMYVLDPENGRRRRQYLSDKSADALDSAVHRARDLGSVVADRASDWTGRLADHANDWSDSVSSGVADRASDASDAASDRWSDLKDRAGDWSDSASRAARAGMSALHLDAVRERLGSVGHQLWRRARHLGRHASDSANDYADNLTERALARSHAARHALAKTIDPEHVRGTGHAVGWSAAGVGTVALGAGLMYLFDPRLGRGRRARLMDQTAACLRDTGATFRRTGRDLMNRARGFGHEASGQAARWSSSAARATGLSGDALDVDGERLLHRIRSELGHILSTPTDVQLMCDAEGRVTLYGQIPANEVDATLACIRAIPGVTEVNNHAAAGTRYNTTVPQM